MGGRAVRKVKVLNPLIVSLIQITMFEYQEALKELYQISLPEGVNWSYVARNFAISSIPGFLAQYSSEKMPKIGLAILIYGIPVTFISCSLNPEINVYLQDNQFFYNFMGVLAGILNGAIGAKALYYFRNKYKGY